MALAVPPGIMSPSLRRRLNEVSLAVAFLTRLPWIPADWTPPLMSAAWAFPWAGALLGLVCGAVAAGAATLGLDPWLAATLGLGANMLFTGCLHEDGIADSADGIGSGRDRDRSLEILRDSRIGTYGVVAALFSLLIRIGALAMLLKAGPWGLALPAWMLAAAWGRAVGPLFTRLSPPARADGVGAGAGRPSIRGTVEAIAATVLGALVWSLGVGLGVVGALCVALLPVVWLRWLAIKRLGGYTGDVIGAAILLAECSALVMMALPWVAGGAP